MSNNRRVGILAGLVYRANLTLSSNINDVDLRAYVLANTGWNGFKRLFLNLTINSGVTVGSTSASTPALTVSGFNGRDTIIINNRGNISGRSQTTAGGQLTGGTALSLSNNTTLQNTGVVSGGAGSPAFSRAQVLGNLRSGTNNNSNTYLISTLISTYGPYLNGGWIATGAGGGSRGSGRTFVRQNVYDRSCGSRAGCAVAARDFNYTGGRLYANIRYGSYSTPGGQSSNNTTERTTAINNAVNGQIVAANNVDITDDNIYSASGNPAPGTSTSSNSIRLFLPAVNISAGAIGNWVVGGSNLVSSTGTSAPFVNGGYVA